MFRNTHQPTNKGRDPVVEFERHSLRMAIELARAEGFEGTEAALVELLRALEEGFIQSDRK